MNIGRITYLKLGGEGVAKMHDLYTDHVTIRSELNYLIGANVVMLQFRVFAGKSGPIAMVWVFMW
jgi:hypothetical protein